MCGLLLFLCCQYKCWLLHMNLPRALALGRFISRGRVFFNEEKGREIFFCREL